MKLSLIKESRKVNLDKFEKQEINKAKDVLTASPSKEVGRNIDVMSKIKRKRGKETTFYIKKYKTNKPYPKCVNGVLEYASYKIVKYYQTINNEIKIPRAIHMSFEEDDKQFTLASSVNFKNINKMNAGARTITYRAIANKNIFFFSLIGYADTHAGNIVSDDKNNYYLIDFDYSFNPFGDKLLSLYTSQMKVPEIRHSVLNSYKMYKEINIQKIRIIITNAFIKANRLLDEQVDKLEKRDYDDIVKELKKLQETMVNNLYYNKKKIDDFAKFHNLDEALKTHNKDTMPDYFDIQPIKKNLSTPYYS